MRNNEKRFRRIRRSSAAWAALFIVAALLGCSVREEHNGDSKKVDLSTPFGGLKVRTEVNPKDVGLAIYPKARLKPSENSDDDKSANVNISTPFFGIKVVALEYESDDPPEKVLNFYRKEMARYGKVAQCKGSEYEHHKSDHGMTLTLDCDQGSDDKSVELKAGEGSSQHIVGVKPREQGSDFGLVYIQIRGKSETM
jgi:hypothetical protein